MAKLFEPTILAKLLGPGIPEIIIMLILLILLVGLIIFIGRMIVRKSRLRKKD